MNTDTIYAQKIASEYAKRKSRKAIALYKLDRWAKRPAKIISYAFGTFMGVLLVVGIWLQTISPTLSLIIAIIALIGMSLSYPLYSVILNHRKKVYADDILLLAQAVIEEENAEVF